MPTAMRTTPASSAPIGGSALTRLPMARCDGAVLRRAAWRRRQRRDLAARRLVRRLASQQRPHQSLRCLTGRRSRRGSEQPVFLRWKHVHLRQLRRFPLQPHPAAQRPQRRDSQRKRPIHGGQQRRTSDHRIEPSSRRRQCCPGRWRGPFRGKQHRHFSLVGAGQHRRQRNAVRALLT